jgi:hypothetical protein
MLNFAKFSGKCAFTPVLHLQVGSTPKVYFFHRKIFSVSPEIAHENMTNFAKFLGKCRENFSFGLMVSPIKDNSKLKQATIFAEMSV